MGAVKKQAVVAPPAASAAPLVRKVVCLAQARSIHASYDNARTTDENAKMWQYVDALSAAAANSPEVRRTIRNRARYEVANNCYAAGVVDTLANDVVGPYIQLSLGNAELADQVERDFHAWAREIRLFSKIRTMRRAKCVDGEAFALLITNRKLRNEIKLDVRPIECDMVEGWIGSRDKVNEIDGIRFDGETPTAYRVLKNHPGDYRSGIGVAGEWTPAKFVLHYFRQTRPGQVRGVSEILPALGLFGQLRKYTTAVIETATRAAEITGIIYTDLLPDNVAAELSDPTTIIEIERNALLSLPEGWKLLQLKPEQPTTTYKEFKAEIIAEMCRVLSMPYNVGAGNSSGYNYASGRLDHQTYDRNLEIDRDDLTAQVLDRVFYAFMDEYAPRKGLSKGQLESIPAPSWNFTNRKHVDPNKEAMADDTRFNNGSLSRTSFFAEQGKDGKREMEQIIRETIDGEIAWNKARAEAGLPPAPYPFAPKSNGAPVEPDGDKDEDKETKDEA